VAVVSMSKQEFSRLDVLLRVQSGRLRVSDACVLIGLQRRQVFRLLRNLKQGSWSDKFNSMTRRDSGKLRRALAALIARWCLSRHPNTRQSQPRSA
jgi:hypothetical protein